MGDTGSLFLGGVVVALAFAVGRPILLILAGIVYIAEAFSVILQVAYYKKTKNNGTIKKEEFNSSFLFICSGCSYLFFRKGARLSRP